MNFTNLEQKLALESGALDSLQPALSRRQFIKLSSLAGFAIGVTATATPSDAAIEASPAALKAHEMPSEFLQILPSGEVRIVVNRLEFGQGTHTGLARILADELDADWSMVSATLGGASASNMDPFYGMQFTGGSTAIKHSFTQYRQLGARARMMLIAAAAEKWGVVATDLSTSNSTVTGPNGLTASYAELAESAMAQDIPLVVELKPIGDFRYIGKSVERLDTPAKSTGKQLFGIDVNLPESRTVLIARPPTFGGKIKSFDATKALAVTGVEDVFEVSLDRNATGVAVVANGYWPAKLGRDALVLDWLNGSEVLPDSAALSASYTKLLAEPGLVVAKADQAPMESAAQRIKADFSFPYLAHTPMEPLNASIEVQGEGAAKQVIVYSGTQFQTFDQAKVAQVMGVSPSQVTIHTQFAGGGFGRRATGNSDCLGDTAQVMKAWMARGHSAPIKLVWSREDDVRGGYYRPFTMHRADIGLNDAGTVVAWKHCVVQPALVVGTPLEPISMPEGKDASATEGMPDSPYGIAMSLDVHHPETDVPVLWWRSVGHTHTAFVMETLIDEIASKSAQSPLQLRRSLLKDKPRELATLELVVEKSNYGGPLPKGHAWGLAIHHSFDSVVAHVVEVSIKSKTPVIHKVTSAVHCNLAVNPRSVEAQIQGAVLMGIGTTLAGSEITIKNGQVEQSNFHNYIVPRMPQMPPIDVHIVPSTEPPTGVGEPGLPPIAPAIANAIFALTGKPLRSLPIKIA